MQSQNFTSTSQEFSKRGTFNKHPDFNKKILVVDDEAAILQTLRYNLERSGYNVVTASDGRSAVAIALREQPDLIILDIMLPVLDGIEACKEIRKTSSVPIIMLTAKDQEIDKVLALELGADDYVTKPFSPRELLARINAVLRRSGASGMDELIEFEGLTLDQGSHRVMVGERTVALGPTEYRMLEFFMTHPERVYTRDQLLDRIWGGNVYVEERTIDVHIRRLRKALEDFGYDRFVQTVRGSGYRF